MKRSVSIVPIALIFAFVLVWSMSRPNSAGSATGTCYNRLVGNSYDCSYKDEFGNTGGGTLAFSPLSPEDVGDFSVLVNGSIVGQGACLFKGSFKNPNPEASYKFRFLTLNDNVSNGSSTEGVDVDFANATWGARISAQGKKISAGQVIDDNGVSAVMTCTKTKAP